MARQLEDYDLLPAGANETFRVTFDVYTPRPHFIILPKNRTAITSPDFRSLNDEQMRDLIRAAKSVLLHFEIPFGILSIHEGKWRKTENFHVHIHVNTERYLKILSNTLDKAIPGWEEKIPEDRKNKWPRQEGTWLRKPYKESVRDYPHEKYFQKDLDELEKKLKNQKLSRVQPYSSEAGDIEKIVYHKRHPKISFVVKTIELTKVLLAMKKYADRYGLTNAESRDYDDACHLCLYLGPGTNIVIILFLTSQLVPLTVTVGVI